MRVLETIPDLDVKRLAGLEENAVRWTKAGSHEQKAQAESVLLAMTSERRRRKLAADETHKKFSAEVSDRVKDKGLYDRVIMAFSEMPPEQWEAEVLREIGARPGQDFVKIAKAIGKRTGGYINLAVGTLCHSRDIFRGRPPAAQKRKGDVVWSALLVDFEHHREPDGTEWHGWTLKPEADAALRALKIVV